VDNHRFPETLAKIWNRYHQNTKEMYQVMRELTVRDTGPFREDTRARFCIAMAGILCVLSLWLPEVVIIALTLLLAAMVIRRRLLKLFYQREGLVFSVKGWLVYVVTCVPIATGLLAGMISRLSRRSKKRLSMKRLKLLLQIIKGIFLFEHPSYLVYFVTSRCNCRCSMCFYREYVFADNKPAELSPEEIIKVAKSMYPLPQLLLSGGEPFLRQDVADIVHMFYLHGGTRQISIPTNGVSTDHILRSIEMMLAECPEAFFNINLSLDGIGEDHDRSRGLKGCFSKLCETYEGLRALRDGHRRLSINVLSTIKSDNAGKVMEIIDYVKENFDVNYHLTRLVRGDVDAAERDFDMESVEAKLDAIYAKKGGISKVPVFNRFAPAVSRLLRRTLLRARRQQQRPFYCRAGSKMVVISPEGDLYPCEPLWLEPDVRREKEAAEFMMARLQDYDSDVVRALGSPKAMAVKRFISEKQCSCVYGCAVLNSIVYCPKMYPRLLRELLRR
jgi:MoaA/NifB/PqqE/SkfB family radical SAM enzyme